MGTAVPPPSFGPNGFVGAAESDILAGVLADIDAAFGGGVNPALNSPQGQLASSEAAVIAFAQAMFIALANGVDPAFAAGRMQDAIGRIYFLTRNPAQPTVVVATCTGSGAPIPVGAIAQAQDGNFYTCTEAGTLPALGGSIMLNFACVQIGPINCPPGSLNVITSTVPGWDTITNASAGVLGNVVESRADFEFRRQNSVENNAVGSLPAIRGAVFNVANVLDCYTAENPTASPVNIGATDSITAAIAATTMTVSAVTNGAIVVGDLIAGLGVASNTTVVSQTSGTAGGVGVYVVSPTQTVSSETMTVGGAQLAPNSLYVAVTGGLAADVARAIWTKKAPGCAYNGNTTVAVQDTAPPYTPPYPSYNVTFETPAALPFAFSVKLSNNPSVPANAVALVQAAILSAFAGGDGGPRARTGSSTYASRFYAGVAALGSWVEIVDIQIGSPNAPGAVFTGSISGTVLTVGSLLQGALAIGDALFGPNVAPGTYITGGSGSTWAVSVSQTAASGTVIDVPVNQNIVTALINQAPTLAALNIAVAIA